MTMYVPIRQCRSVRAVSCAVYQASVTFSFLNLKSNLKRNSNFNLNNNNNN